mmetsp:Transcript_92119/g.281947  ORF Transcript_92119/g.281947 Transcript_92119/m.281947 type:complete len:235 (+) Transcript_92119:126-830(+)
MMPSFRPTCHTMSATLTVVVVPWVKNSVRGRRTDAVPGSTSTPLRSTNSRIMVKTVSHMFKSMSTTGRCKYRTSGLKTKARSKWKRFFSLSLNRATHMSPSSSSASSSPSSSLFNSSLSEDFMSSSRSSLSLSFQRRWRCSLCNSARTHGLSKPTRARSRWSRCLSTTSGGRPNVKFAVMPMRETKTGEEETFNVRRCKGQLTCPTSACCKLLNKLRSVDFPVSWGPRIITTTP